MTLKNTYPTELHTQFHDPLSEYWTRDNLVYKRMELFSIEMPDSVLKDDSWPISEREYMNRLTKQDMQKIGFVMSHVQDWACERSARGLLIVKQYDIGSFTFILKGFVYLREEDITFWRLKEGSQPTVMSYGSHY